MKILIIGNGGREHALAWKVAQSKQVSNVFVAPGNAGTTQEAKTKNIDIAPTDINALVQFAKQQAIDLTIVGPEASLAVGVSDAFKKANLACFGPNQQATQLESSKLFSKNLMQKYRIPTAGYAHFSDADEALTYLQTQPFPVVIKADGLAQGKGVVIATSLQEAEEAVHQMLKQKQFGDAGHTIVIEEFLQGQELSYIVMVSGQQVLPLASSQDHKRRDDHDQGPNTGGMGAYSPAPLMDQQLEQRILDTIIHPTVNALQQEGIDYCGFLYAGLMIDEQNNPFVLEFNCRLGDPETQPLLFRLQSDLVTLCLAALDKRLEQQQIHWDPQPALAVVMASGGYPGSYSKGLTINGLDYPFAEHVKLFHAGTSVANGDVVTNGGRVLAVTAKAHNLATAYQQAYQAVSHVHWDNCFYRQDIGKKAL